jgi:predicted NBD/HSP70 family sugar kinase
MSQMKVRSLSSGVNQSGVRDYNERLLLSMLLRYGAMPGSDLARHINLSSQTVSVILRKLEKDGLLERGEPVKGKVGKPSVPMGLAKNGAFSFGLRIGRRSSDLVLIDLHGVVHCQRQIDYSYPMPDEIFSFLEGGIPEITAVIKQKDQHRICGIGIAAPFELWNWHELVGAPEDEFSVWKTVDFAERISAFSTLPVYPVNDATAACRAEHVYGRGKEFRDYAYFFIATFVGGGIVINHSVFEGRQSNAGALGSLRSIGPHGETSQLIDMASIHLLEKRLIEVDIDPSRLWDEPQDWSDFSRYVDPWIRQTAQELAKASLSTCSVIDFEAVLIDGAFPVDVKTALVEQTRRYLATQDTRGLIPPTIEQAEMGGNARAIGAASGPIFSQLFLNANAGFQEA